MTMPTYDFMCDKCELEVEVIQSIKEYDGIWTCVQCGNQMRRIYTHCKFHFTGTKIEDAEFNPGLGKVTRSKRHREELAKQMNVIEVGSDFKSGESMHKHFDSERERKKEESWKKVDDE